MHIWPVEGPVSMPYFHKGLFALGKKGQNAVPCPLGGKSDDGRGDGLRHPPLGATKTRPCAQNSCPQTTFLHPLGALRHCNRHRQLRERVSIVLGLYLRAPPFPSIMRQQSHRPAPRRSFRLLLLLALVLGASYSNAFVSFPLLKKVRDQKMEWIL